MVDLFILFARKCFELFGDRVKNWVTFNEPMVIVEGEYLYRFHYPNLVDGKKACQVLYNLNLASAGAIAAFRESDCASHGGRIRYCTESDAGVSAVGCTRRCSGCSFC